VLKAAAGQGIQGIRAIQGVFRGSGAVGESGEPPGKLAGAEMCRKSLVKVK